MDIWLIQREMTKSMIYCEKEKIVKKLPANKNISINPQILSRLMNHFGENRVKVVEKAIENHF